MLTVVSALRLFLCDASVPPCTPSALHSPHHRMADAIYYQVASDYKNKTLFSMECTMMLVVLPKKDDFMKG